MVEGKGSNFHLPQAAKSFECALWSESTEVSHWLVTRLGMIPGCLSHGGDVVLISIVQLRIQDVARGQFTSRRGPGSPFCLPNSIPALQEISNSITEKALGSFGEGNRFWGSANPEEDS